MFINLSFLLSTSYYIVRLSKYLWGWDLPFTGLTPQMPWRADRIRLKTGTRNCIHVPYYGWQGPNYLGHQLPARHISRKLDQKNSWDSISGYLTWDAGVPSGRLTQYASIPTLLFFNVLSGLCYLTSSEVIIIFCNVYIFIDIYCLYRSNYKCAYIS